MSDLPSELEKKLDEIVERHIRRLWNNSSCPVHDILTDLVREAADAVLDAVLEDAPEHDIGPQHDPFMQGNIRHNLSCARCWLEKHVAALRREKTGGERG